jgi:cardiolipin synthase
MRTIDGVRLTGLVICCLALGGGAALGGLVDIASAGAVPVAAGTLGPLLVEPEDGYHSVDAFIASAKRSVDMTMYELADPTVETELVAAAGRGVDVRVLLDRPYSGAEVNRAAYARLASGGVHVAWSSGGQIVHQKSITVDHSTSLIMTGNLTARYYATTRDFGLFDSRPADVAAIESTFAVDFAGGAPTPAPDGTDLQWSPGSQAALVSLIGSAHSTVVAENEEMDSSPIEAALEADARRGVTVKVVMTASSSWRSAFDRLEASGVHVLVYRGERPLYIHAKAVVVDAGLADQQAFVGSENFSAASLEFNRELGVVTADPTVVGGLSAVLTKDARGGTPWS